MAQGIFGGATSYDEQSLQDILKDIIFWTDYTNDKRQFILEQKELLEQSGWWNKIAYDFKGTICSSIMYFDTILHDLHIVKTSIENNCITAKEVKLLKNIGHRACEYNREYGLYYHKDITRWSDYGNPDFKVAEEVLR